MDNELKIASANCRGLADAKKRRDVFNYLRDLRYSIYFLQDTHFTPENESRIKNEWGLDVYFSSFSSNSRGVAVLFNDNIQYKILDIVKDINGNFLILKVEMFDKIFILVNIYGPNDDKPEFYTHLEEKVEGMGQAENIIFGGDWNLVRDFSMDCFNYRRQNNVEASKQVDELCLNLDLVDVWRQCNPDVRRYTWRRPTPIQQSRLDFFLVNDILAVHSNQVDILPGYRTDHSIITISFQFGEDHPRKSFWKFNCSLLSDSSYLETINDVISDVVAEYAALVYNRELLCTMQIPDIEFTISDQLFLDVLLLKIREKSIQFSSQKKKKIEEKEKTLKDIISKLEGKEILDNVEQTTLSEARNELVEIRENRMKGVFLRARARWVEDGEKATAYFLGLEKRNFVNKYVNRLTLRDGTTTTDHNKIVNEFKTFYQRLYEYRQVEDNPISNLVSDIPTLDEQIAENLEGELTLDEIGVTLKEMKHNKSPGSDGFPAEFFKCFWRQLGGYVLRALNEGFKKGSLSCTQREGVIICLPKPDKDRELVRNWRPITLLNTVYKIASASIANRIKTVLDSILNEDQTGFVKNRYIGDNIRLIYDTIHHLTYTNSPGLLLCLDFEKAFDSLDWKFLFKVMHAFGFKNDICRWINVLYFGIKSTLSINGSISEWFQVSRGCRQGDPVSPYLFVMCVEIMAIMIRENNLIKGISINNIETKISQYADDSEILLDNDRVSFEETIRTIDTFGKSSGLKLNVEKTNAVWLGSMRNSNQKFMPHLNIKWNPPTFKILGIVFTNDLVDCVDINFRDKFLEIKRLYKVWLKRQITPLGRIAVLKSLILSKLIYLWLLLPNPPDSIVDDIQISIFAFIWNKKNDKIGRTSSTQNFEHGGIGIPNVKSYIKALKLSWIKKISFSNHKWKHIFVSVNPFVHHFKSYGTDIPLGDLSHSEFWKNVFLCL